MSAKMAALTFLFLMAFAVPVADGTKTWFCPFGWLEFIDSDHFQCLGMDLLGRQVSNFSSAVQMCQSRNSELVTIFSQAKWSMVKVMMIDIYTLQIWTALKRDNDYPRPTWRTSKGRKEMTFAPPRFYKTRNIGCVVSTAAGAWSIENCNQGYRSVVCEMKPTCRPKWYGDRCEKPCHCYNFECTSPEFHGKCPFGCDPGWMGEGCKKERTKASVGFQCILSPTGDKYATVVIDNKGTDYLSIEAVANSNSSTPTPWCNGTTVVRTEYFDLVIVKIPLTNESMAEMGLTCAGEEVADDVYEWRINIQEFKDVLLPYDQQVLVKCNFSQAQSLERTGNVISTENRQINVSQVDESIEDLILEVVDAGSREKLSKGVVGNPIVLKVRFGFQNGSLVKSVAPYDCEARTADGKKAKLLDSDGCQVEGSPVKPFLPPAEDFRKIETPWFPFFSFGGFTDVSFHCSFTICYDFTCQTGCARKGSWYNKTRHIRSVRSDMNGQAMGRIGVAMANEH